MTDFMWRQNGRKLIAFQGLFTPYEIKRARFRGGFIVKRRGRTILFDPLPSHARFDTVEKCKAWAEANYNQRSAERQINVEKEWGEL